MKGLEVLQKLNSGKFMRIPEWDDDMYIKLVEGVALFDDGRQAPIEINDLYYYDWEQYIERFKEGDWVINLSSKRVHRIESVRENGQYLTNHQGVLHETNLRKATPEEIKVEEDKLKELKQWINLGREFNEYKENDIICNRSGENFIGFVSWREGDVLSYLTPKDNKSIAHTTCVSKVKLICASENRLDLQ